MKGERERMGQRERERERYHVQSPELPAAIAHLLVNEWSIPVGGFTKLVFHQGFSTFLWECLAFNCLVIIIAWSGS